MSPETINKQRVAQSFSRAAVTYDDSAALQRDIGHALLAMLPQTEVPETVIDLGCGTGYFTSYLKQTYPQANLVNLDLAQGMLQFAKQNRSALNTCWVCADAESLPIKDNSADLIFSSLAIQWCKNLPQLFSEINRVLKLGGEFVVATLGPDTLNELKTAWRAVDDYVHVNPFESITAIKQALPSTLAIAGFEESYKVLKYAQLKQLTDELKGIGAHNMNAGQQTGLTGRENVKRFKQAYEAQRCSEGALPATYHVYYIVFKKLKGQN